MGDMVYNFCVGMVFALERVMRKEELEFWCVYVVLDLGWLEEFLFCD